MTSFFRAGEIPLDDDEKKKKKAADDVPLEPPPPEEWYLLFHMDSSGGTDLLLDLTRSMNRVLEKPNIPAVQEDILKLTAQFVARNGAAFQNGIMARENAVCVYALPSILSSE